MEKLLHVLLFLFLASCGSGGDTSPSSLNNTNPVNSPPSINNLSGIYQPVLSVNSGLQTVRFAATIQDNDADAYLIRYSDNDVPCDSKQFTMSSTTVVVPWYFYVDTAVAQAHSFKIEVIDLAGNVSASNTVNIFVQ